MNLKVSLCLIGALALAACSTEEPSALPVNTRNLGAAVDSPAFTHPGTPLAPKAALYNGVTTAIVRHLEPGGAAEKAGVQVGDELVRLNGKKFFSANAFDHALKVAPQNSSITLKRGDSFKMIPVILGRETPRFGASFEPEGKPLRRQSSPYIAYMHVKDVTVYAETSLNELKKELHVNFIVKSDRLLPIANMSFLIEEKGQHTPLGKGFDRLDALGSTPHLINKVFKKEGDLKGPLQVMLNVDKRLFQFEFQ